MTAGAGRPPLTRKARAAAAARQEQIRRRRLAFVAGAAVMGFMAVMLRLGDLMLFPSAGEERAWRAEAEANPGRADIVDREGRVLATDIRTAGLYADPLGIWDPQSTAGALAAVFPELDTQDLAAKLASDKRFVWIKRDLTPRQQYDVHKLGLGGLHFLNDFERLYPSGDLVSHLVGLVDVDGTGVAGLELGLEEAIRTGGRRGEPVALTIDLRLQHTLREELLAAMARHSAIGAAGLIMDVRSGGIAAMVSLPDFDPHAPGGIPSEARFNRVTSGVYEQGSTFKAFTIAAALEEGIADLDTVYDATNPLKVGRFTIRDYKAKKRPLTVPEIFVYSSNIGTALMARDLGPKRHRAFLGTLGLLEPVALEMPESGAPLLPPRWKQLETMTIGYGHGLAVSPLHVAKAAASLVNGGTRVEPTLLLAKAEAAKAGPRVLSEETSQAMIHLLRLNVEKGSGRKADTEYYPVGGKTGTAEKARGGGYAEKALMSSFLGVFPADRPQYVILVALDEPKGTKETYGYATAGWVAAPVVRNVVSRVGSVLAFAPGADRQAQFAPRRPDTAVDLADAGDGPIVLTGAR